MPISAVDTITLAFQHTKRQLMQPFRIWQWTRLAIVGLLAGEAGSGGSFNFPTNLRGLQQDQSSRHLGTGFPHIDPSTLAALISVIVVTGLVFMVVMIYISSVMRFILFDSVLAKECHIRDGWSRRQNEGWKYFLWQLGFTVVTLVAFVVVLGIPALFAYSKGWFHAPGEHVLGLVLGGIVVFLLLVILFIAVALIHVLTKDFVIPQMAFEGIDAVEGWRRLWPMLQNETLGYAGYIGMKIVLAICAAIVIGIAGVIVSLLFVIPVAGVAVAVIIGGKGAGLTWNAFTITAAIVAGCILLAILLYLIALISVPVFVFFPAYAIYFFAARYRPLGVALYPPPPNAPPPYFPPAAPQPAG